MQDALKGRVAEIKEKIALDPIEEALERIPDFLEDLECMFPKDIQQPMRESIVLIAFKERYGELDIEDRILREESKDKTLLEALQEQRDANVNAVHKQVQMRFAEYRKLKKESACTVTRP